MFYVTIEYIFNKEYLVSLHAGGPTRNPTRLLSITTERLYRRTLHTIWSLLELQPCSVSYEARSIVLEQVDRNTTVRGESLAFALQAPLVEILHCMDGTKATHESISLRSFYSAVQATQLSDIWRTDLFKTLK